MLSKMMLKSHEMLDSLMDNFESSVRNNDALLVKVSKFNNFKWALINHHSLEEKTIFFSSDFSDGLSVMADKLVDDHKIILSLLDDLESTLSNGDSLDKIINVLKVLLEQHRNFEDSEFYPLLDDTLDDSQKELLIGRIKSF